jgi:peroxiredoxin Q/BCP
MHVKSLFAWGASIALGVTAGLLGFAQQTTELKVGDPAPAFSLQGSDGKVYRLADFKGKSAVVLAWFPKAFTGG